jgi:hypothetical protein
MEYTVFAITNNDFVMDTVATTDRKVEATADDTTRAVSSITATPMAVVALLPVLTAPTTLVREVL